MESRGQSGSGRAHNLLVALTSVYINTGEPVSSAALSKALEKAGERVAPSTVRLDLQDLERRGFLTKLHPSGGRIPTARAYQEYVDSLEPPSPDLQLSRKLADACRALSGELGRLLDFASDVLARESGHLGFVTSPSLADARIARFKMDPLEENLLLLRLELQSGRSYHHLARLPAPVRSFRLDALAMLLTERMGGRGLGEVSEAEIEALVRRAAEWGRGYDLFVHPLHDLITDARLGEGPRTVLHGAAGLLKASGEDAETLSRAVALLDDRSKMEQALGAAPDPDEPKVLIGGDGASATDPTLQGLAMVVASYHVHARARGRLGILGPLRMPYARHLSLVRSVSDLISRVLIAREVMPYPG